MPIGPNTANGQKKKVECRFFSGIDQKENVWWKHHKIDTTHYESKDFMIHFYLMQSS